MSIKSIVIIGSSIEAWLPAAYLRARLPAAYSICVIEIDKPHDDYAIIARPSSKELHHLLHHSEQDLARGAQAKPLLAAQINAASSNILLPFGRYGIDRDGAEFQHLWRRVNPDDRMECLNDYNLSIAMHRAGLFMPQAPQSLPQYEYGYILSANGYQAMLQKSAVDTQTIAAKTMRVHRDGDHISSVDCGGQSVQADLYIDATQDSSIYNISADMKPGDSSNVWRGNCLSISAGFENIDHQSGMRLYRLQKAMERLIALWPDSDFAACELNEYNRLTLAQQEHINDMNILIIGDKKSMQSRPALVRKTSVFSARGRVTSEDYEVFSKAEWIAALIAAHMKPASYDRLADRADLDVLRQWVKQLEQAIREMIIMIKQKQNISQSRTVQSEQDRGIVRSNGNISNISRVTKK